MDERPLSVKVEIALQYSNSEDEQVALLTPTTPTTP